MIIKRDFETCKTKGEVGEGIVEKLLNEKGYIIYKSNRNDIGHWLDWICIKNKTKAIAVDIKTKSRLTYINATGIDEQYFQEYVKFSKEHNMPFVLIFVDEFTKTIYGNTIDELQKPMLDGNREYPSFIKTKFGKELHLWSLKSMKHLSNLSEEDVKKIKENSSRNYDYPKEIK